MGNTTSPTSTEPTSHVSFTDGTNTVELVLYNSFGGRDHKAIKRFPLVESALKIVEGESRYSDDEIPTISQEDFSGGRGNEIFEKDRSRFYDSWRMNTQREGVVLGAREIYTDGDWRTHENYLPGSGWSNANHYNYGVYFRSLLTTKRFLAMPFTAAHTYSSTAANVELWLKYHGTPSAITIAVYSNVGGSPGSAIWSETISISSLDEENVSQLYLHDVDSPFSLTSSTAYWFVVYGNSGDDSSNYWEVGVGGATLGKYSSDGSSWSSGSYSNPYFRISADDTHFTPHFFEYKGQLYFATQNHDGTTAKLYMNGFRGAADDPSPNKDRLVDAAQSFGLFYDGVCKFVAGDPSALENVPWRRCTIINSTTLQMDRTWETWADDMDEYVILGTDVWSEIGDSLGKFTTPVKDVAVGNGIVFFAQAGGDTVAHREFNNYGTWQSDTDCWKYAGGHAHYIEMLNDLERGPTLWMARNPNAYSGAFRTDYKSWIMRARLPDAWDDAHIFWKQLDSGQDAWDEQVISNVTTSFTDNNVKFALTDSFTTGIVGSEAITSTNLTYGNYIELTVKVGTPFQAGELQLLLSNLANCVTPIFTLNFPSLKPDEAQTCRLYFDAEGVTGADAVISIGLQITADKNKNFSIEIIGETIYYLDREPIKIGTDAENVTGTQIYDDPERFWVFTEGEIGYMQNDIYTPIPLREMRSLKSSYNGRASCVAGVYLYFSMGAGRVMRYFRQNIDSIGPDRDAGLPSGRRGNVSAMVSYPGDKVIIAVNGGMEDASSPALHKTSSILMYSGNGWHELYRAPRGNLPITSLYIQSIDGSDTQRLWFNQGADILWLPITPNPERDPDYRFAHEGHLITSWYYANKQALEKVWHSLSLFAENLDASADPVKYTIEVDYQTDGDTTWTAFPSVFDTSPTETILLTSGANTNVTGRRIRFRFRFLTTDPKETPRLMASVVKAYAVQDIKYGYAMTTKLSEDDLSIDLEGDEIGSGNFATRLETTTAQLDSWSANLTKLTMNTIFSPFDNKSVYMKSIPSQPFTVLPDDQIEEAFLNITVHEWSTS